MEALSSLETVSFSSAFSNLHRHHSQALSRDWLRARIRGKVQRIESAPIGGKVQRIESAPIGGKVQRPSRRGNPRCDQNVETCETRSECCSDAKYAKKHCCIFIRKGKAHLTTTSDTYKEYDKFRPTHGFCKMPVRSSCKGKRHWVKGTGMKYSVSPKGRKSRKELPHLLLNAKDELSWSKYGFTNTSCPFPNVYGFVDLAKRRVSCYRPNKQKQMYCHRAGLVIKKQQLSFKKCGKLSGDSKSSCEQQYGAVLKWTKPFACDQSYFTLDPWSTRQGLTFWTEKRVFCHQVNGKPSCHKTNRGKCFRCPDISYKSILNYRRRSGSGSDHATGRALNKLVKKCLNMKNIPGTGRAMWQPKYAVPTCSLRRGLDVGSGCECHPNGPGQRMFEAQVLVGG